MTTTVVASWSEIDTYRQCPHKHDLQYKQRWKREEAAPALTRGTAWHGVMEAHYNRIGNLDPSISIEDAFDAIVDDETRDLIRWMYEGYTAFYGDDPEWEIVAVEYPFQVWLPTLTGGRSRFKLKGKIDLIIRWKGKLYIVDHKSCKDLPTGKKLELDDQFGLYTWAMKQLGKNVFGSMHSAARTHRNTPKPESLDTILKRADAAGLLINMSGEERTAWAKEQQLLYPDAGTTPQPLESRFRRTPLYRGDAELDRIAKDAYLTLKNAYGGNESERNTDPDRCGWRCPFTDACLHGRKTTSAQEIDYLRNAGYVQDFTRH
jgi:hypothetical protein